MYRCKNDGCGYRFTPSETLPKMRHSIKEVVKGLRYYKEDKISLLDVSDILRDENVFVSYNGIWKWDKITTNILKAFIDTFEFQIEKEKNETNQINDKDLKFLVKNIKFLVMRNKLINYMLQEKIATWKQLEEKFGISKSTLMRRLQTTELTVSINHNKKYLALEEIVEKNANENGIWRADGVVFSTLGALNSTIVNLVEKSESGMSMVDIKNYLNTSPKQNVIDLLEEEKITCDKFGHKHVYFSLTKSEEQIKARINMEPECTIKLNAKDVKFAAQKVGERVRNIVKDAIEHVDIKEGDMSMVDVLIASVMKPLKHIDSDRHLARHLKNNSTLDGFYNFEEPPGHSTISSVKKEFGEEGYKFVFQSMVMWILTKLDIKELIIAVDTTHAFKSQNNKWGIKIHIAGMHPFGIPIAFVLMDGKAHDMTTFEDILDILLSYGIKIKFIIGDGAYDNADFYYLVAVKAKGEGIAPYNPRRSGFKDKPTNLTLFELLNIIAEEYHKAKKEDKNRRGPKRKNQIFKGIVLSDPYVQGKMLRDFPLTEWNSKERGEIYKHRTLAERINSILKLWLGLENLRTYSNDARIFNIYSSFISLLIVSMLAIELEVPEAMLRVSIWDL